MVFLSIFVQRAGILADTDCDHKLLCAHAGLQVCPANVDNAGMKSSSRITGLSAVCPTSPRVASLASLGFALFVSLMPAAQAQEPPALSQADADPSVGELQLPPASKQPLREDRLWLSPAHASHREALVRAARQALLHAECNEVLYGGLNEFRTEHEGTSFTILCMRDGRTTFNQVFFQADLMTDEDIRARSPGGAAELERLRLLMQQPAGVSSGSQPVQPPAGQTPTPQPSNGPPPVVF